MRSPRFDAATRDLGEIYAEHGWLAQGDLAKVAARHSATEQERLDLMAYLNTPALPRASGPLAPT